MVEKRYRENLGRALDSGSSAQILGFRLQITDFFGDVSFATQSESKDKGLSYGNLKSNSTRAGQGQEDVSIMFFHSFTSQGSGRNRAVMEVNFS